MTQNLDFALSTLADCAAASEHYAEAALADEAASTR
jgi:hypothetical protein